MSYETKAGVAVSCSFLCLVGVVLSSKLWEGQPANAGTTTGAKNGESAGTHAQASPNTVSPESKLPNLKAPPGGDQALQQVAGAGNSPRISVENLFKNDDDPFQGTPSADSGGVKQPPATAAAPPPGFKVPQGGGEVLAKQPDPATDPKSSTGLAGGNSADPKKSGAPSFEEMANQLKKQVSAADASGSSAVKTAQDAVKAGANDAGAAQAAAGAGGKSLDEMVLEAEKRERDLSAASQNPAPVAPRSAPVSSDDFLKQLMIQKEKAQGAAPATDPSKAVTGAVDATVGAGAQQIKNGAGSLAAQANAGIDALNDPLKKTAGAADAALAAGQQQLNNGAALAGSGMAAAQNAANAGNDVANAGRGAMAAGAAALTSGVNATTGAVQPRFPLGPTDGSSVQSSAGNQPRIPTNAGDGYAIPTDSGAAGNRTISPVSLGAPTSPPENQYAQLRNGQPAPGFQPPPPYGARPDAAVQPIPVAVPLRSVPVQKDSWDDDLYLARAGDTYQSIARDYYKSDKYGQALMLYNRDYDGQSPDASKRDPAAIVSGQKIFVPPERILKRDYSSVILDQPAGNAGSATGAVPSSAGQVGAAYGTKPEKTYRVRGSGEMFLTIARNTLGNEERWPEIYLLNKGFETTKFIPGGTILRLPGDAKVDPADAP